MIEQVWRTEALRCFPELSETIERAETPYQFWNDLLFKFFDAYDSDRAELVSRIYEYARWSCEQPRGETAADDLATCVTVCFFEHIPEHPKAVADMPRWWSHEEIKRMKDVFSHLAGEEGYARILAQYDTQQPI